MHRWMVAGLMAAGLAGFSGVASAQRPQTADDEGGMYCVYDDLVSDLDYELVAEAFLYGDVGQEDLAAAKELVDKAATACTNMFSLTPAQEDAAANIGIYGATSDYLSEELLFEGVDEDAIDGIFTAMDDFTDDDLARILEDGWRNDAAFVAKVKAALMAKGVPDETYVMDTAYQIIMVSSLALDSVFAFMLEEEDS